MFKNIISPFLGYEYYRQPSDNLAPSCLADVPVYVYNEGFRPRLVLDAAGILDYVVNQGSDSALLRCENRYSVWLGLYIVGPIKHVYNDEYQCRYFFLAQNKDLSLTPD